MPRFVTPRFLDTIRHFNRFLQIQGHEPVYLLRRKWKGPTRDGYATSYETFTESVRSSTNPLSTEDVTYYYFILWDPDNSPITGRPRISTLRVFIDGVQASIVEREDISADNEVFIGVNPGTWTSTDNTGTLYVGFNGGYNPTNHTVTYDFEEVCRCVNPDDRDAFRPGGVSSCTECYGTGYVGGYDQYLIVPQLDCGKIIQPENTILVRFPMHSRNVTLDKLGFEAENLNKGWMASTPEIADWDVIVRRTDFGAAYQGNQPTPTTERYWITSHELSTLRFPAGEPGINNAQPNVLHQTFLVQEIQYEHSLYQYPLVGLDINFKLLNFSYSVNKPVSDDLYYAYGLGIVVQDLYYTYTSIAFVSNDLYYTYPLNISVSNDLYYTNSIAVSNDLYYIYDINVSNDLYYTYNISIITQDLYYI